MQIFLLPPKPEFDLFSDFSDSDRHALCLSTATRLWLPDRSTFGPDVGVWVDLPASIFSIAEKMLNKVCTLPLELQRLVWLFYIKPLRVRAFHRSLTYDVEGWRRDVLDVLNWTDGEPKPNLSTLEEATCWIFRDRPGYTRAPYFHGYMYMKAIVYIHPERLRSHLPIAHHEFTMLLGQRPGHSANDLHYHDRIDYARDASSDGIHVLRRLRVTVDGEWVPMCLHPDDDEFDDQNVAAIWKE